MTDIFVDEQEKEQYLERFIFVTERIRAIYEETAAPDCSVAYHGRAFGEYFHRTAGFLLLIEEVWRQRREGDFASLSLEGHRELNHKLYEDVLGEHYQVSFANPDVAAEKLGGFSKVLCTLYTELRSTIVYVFEDRLFYLTTLFELFTQIYNILEQKDAEPEEVRSCIYYYYFDYADITARDGILDSFDPSRDFAERIICGCDFSDLRYLYEYGEYISENEIKMAKYLAGLTQKEIHDTAFTLTDGYRRGFSLYHIDLSKKSIVNLRYRLGFERMLREIIRQLGDMGLKPVIYRSGISIRQRSLRGKVGYFGASPNKQYEYDHRMDDALFFDKAYGDRVLKEQRKALEKEKSLCSAYAGPVLIETFGETPFNPAEKKTALRYSKHQQSKKLDFQSAKGLMLNEYVPGEETSFSIISYPLPEIGSHFPEIFRETIAVNTLDQEKYLEIQTKIISALDKGDYVTVTGRGENHTKLTVALNRVEKPEKETCFENCLADVNIPLGEVFTTPRLKGTNGLLHVTRVFLNELEYHDLRLNFTDGIISDYSCSNFDDDEKNRKYIKENVLFQHDTLPMGEFAIGTNTSAYAMGQKYEISHLLPILIAEKTGPHFAVGDTCFSHEEELVTCNPDGKRMMAKENEYSLLRHTDSGKAYFNCHTDITIPYDELGDICVHTPDGGEIYLIRQGRFVLPGTEELNEPLEDLLEV